MMKKYSLEKKIISSIILTTLLALFLSMFIMTLYFNKQNTDTIKQTLKERGDHLAQSSQVIETLETRKGSDALQNYMNELITLLHIDFIVILDTNLVRLTHPVSSKIGNEFSSKSDAEKALAGKSYYTKNQGVLGDGLRYFTPIYNKTNTKVIGVLCIGNTLTTIKNDNQQFIQNLYLVFIVLLLLILIPVIYIFKEFYRKSKGKTIDEVLFSYHQQTQVWNGIEKGVIALDVHKRIIFNNLPFKEMFGEEINQKKKQKYLSDNLFKELFIDNQPHKELPLFYKDKQYVVNSYPVVENEKIVGYIATINSENSQRDIQLELTGAKQYLDNLRSHQHEFMNKMHIISGLLEIGDYREAQIFLTTMQNSYQTDVGHLKQLIKTPLITGFLMGKINQAKENKVSVLINPTSYISLYSLSHVIYDFLQIIGIVIDNGIDACNEKAQGIVEIKLYEDDRIIGATVSNNGPMIPLVPVEKIFEKNFSSKGKYRGTGLYIAQGLVNRNNGKIKVTSDKCKTLFTVELVKDGENEFEGINS